jgi:hypothetical protein
MAESELLADLICGRLVMFTSIASASADSNALPPVALLLCNTGSDASHSLANSAFMRPEALLQSSQYSRWAAMATLMPVDNCPWQKVLSKSSAG